MKCLITGATGFIGQALCSEIDSLGWNKTLTSRRGSALRNGQPTRAWELGSPVPSSLFDGVDCVIHLAGVAHRRGSAREYLQVNTSATLALAQNAARAGVRHFVFVSSVLAMGPARSAGARAEADCSPPEDAYGQSKWAAECALRETYTDSPLAVSIVRPVLVHGPGVKGNLAALARAVKLGLPPPPQGGLRSMVAVQDLSRLLCLVAQAPQSSPTCYIASAEAHSLRTIVTTLRAAAGKSPGRSWLPLSAWRAASRLLDLASANAAGTYYDRLFAEAVFSGERARSLLGWQPEMQFSDNAAAIRNEVSR